MLLIPLLFLITFGPPILFLILGLSRWKSDRRTARVFLILGTAWLIIGGGACASILTGI
jgi:hypothetical protein